jgi:type IV pilus assembly protein PilQ
LKTQTFQLNYAKAAEIADQLASKVGGGGARLLSNRGSAIAMARNNQLIVTDVPSKIDAVQQLIAKMDVPVRQVLIEARIVEASDTFGRSLGVKLGGGSTSGSNRVAFGNDYANAIATANGAGSTSGTFLNMRATGQGGYDPATFAVSLFNPSKTQFLNLELSALEAEGKGKIVSSPRVITADQVKALIEQGTQLPYQAATSSGATSVSFVKANLKLEVTPQITPEGNIILEVDVNKDSVGQATAAGYAIDTKHVKTQVLIENGGTVMIGGIFEMTESDSVTKVPLLGDVPVFGNLFKAKQKTYNKSELLIFITPKMLAEKLGTR